MEVAVSSLVVASRPRAFVRVAGPDAEDYLQRMLSNDVAALSPGDSCEALLLTAKARVIAPMVLVRRGQEDFLLLTEPELGERLRSELLRMRFAAKAEIDLEEHESHLRLGPGAEPEEGALSLATSDYGLPGWEVVGAAAPADAQQLSDEELDALRIRAGTPRYGREIDDRVLPAEAGLVERAVSLTKGCYPGQEPIARLHYRGHANRGLRVLALDGDDRPEPDAELRLGEKAVGRVTSAVRTPDGVVALAYVRAEVPPDAELALGSRTARPLH